MSALFTACKAQYESDLTTQNHCCVVALLTDKHKAANRAVFSQLCAYQEELEAKGQLPYSGTKDSRKDKSISVKSSLTGENVKITYPEGLAVHDPRVLKQILPIPDIHQITDCDTIYRYLIARKFDVALAVSDVLHYIAFREKYALNDILWDPEVEAFNGGLDGEELVQETIDAIAKRAKDKKADLTKPDDIRDKVPLKKIKVSRPLLQPGWAAWNCGVDKAGHVVFYQRPNPRDLAGLVKRWPYVENKYDARNPDFHAVTEPYCNLLTRNYLHHFEKGRRISRLLNYDNQHILRNGLKVDLAANSINGGPAVVAAAAEEQQRAGTGFNDNGGGIDCLVDVGCVKVSHLTGSKCRNALLSFKIFSIMGQYFYPENMKRMIIINGGMVFNFVFKLIKPWLDPQTQKKIILLSATNKTGVTDLASDTASHDKSKSGGADDGGDDGSDDDDSTPVHHNDSNFGLLKSLNEYIDDHFIPSWYGGKLPVHEAPLFYGSDVPKKFADSPFWPLAQEKLRQFALPDLLTNQFLIKHGAGGKPVSDAEFQAFCEETKDTLFKK